MRTSLRNANTVTFELWLEGAKTHNGFRTSLVNIDTEKPSGCTTALQLNQIHGSMGSKPIFQWHGRSNHDEGLCCESEKLDTNGLHFDVNGINQFIFTINSSHITLHVNGDNSIVYDSVCYGGNYHFEPPSLWPIYPLTLLAHTSIHSSKSAYRLSLYYFSMFNTSVLPAIAKKMYDRGMPASLPFVWNSTIDLLQHGIVSDHYENPLYYHEEVPFSDLSTIDLPCYDLDDFELLSSPFNCSIVIFTSLPHRGTLYDASTGNDVSVLKMYAGLEVKYRPVMYEIS